MAAVVMTPLQVYKLIESNKTAKNHVIIDIRSGTESMVPGAKKFSNQQLLQHADALKEQYHQVFLLCKNGHKSQQLAELLGAPFLSITGGFDDWQVAGLPTVANEKIDWYSRYSQQIKLPGFGKSAQQKLAAAHIAVVGAGGLGSPALLYLVAAGVGKITLIDDDQVVLENLHRQILYSEADVGLNKATRARSKLVSHNSTCQLKAHTARLVADNVNALLTNVDFIIDGTDNFETRFLINDYCLANSKPWVFAAVSGFELQIAILGAYPEDICLRCLYPNSNSVLTANCETEGVLGVVTGLAALLQVTEAIKYLVGLGDCLQRQLLSYNVLTHRFKMLKYPADLQCPHR
ncbi:MAG: ThiF family adenylyltransferase [Marinicella sp.]